VETLKLYWLGAPQVELKGQVVKLETRKAAALLCYLSLLPGECQRELLATMFWPEGSQQKALANLRRTLSSLNASLPGWIEANRDILALKRNGKLWMDVDAFHQSLLNYHQHTHLEEETCDGCLHILEETVEMVRGEFLEGLNLTDAPDFDEWQFFQRDGLRQEYADVLRRLAVAHAERGQWKQAITYARRWVGLDHLHEPARRALIDLYIRSGQRTAALRQYEEFTSLLKEELGQDPEEETRQLYEQIRGGEEAKRVVEVPESPTSFPLLKTKLYIPAPPASRVVRAHLLDRLDEVERRALTIISAPAGFGKTTLLAEWIAQTSLPVAWLSLDNGDNDPYRFLDYLIAASESIQEGIGIEARQITQAPQLASPYIILASLMNDLGKIARPYVLVLDDYQFITEHAVHEMLAYLLDHIPSNMHLIISTRADPPLQLGRLRAHELMLELRTTDLRFNVQETTEFLNTVMRLSLSVEDIEALETRTEGWVVGLKMAALSLRENENAGEFIRAFSGSHRYVLDYLVEEVLKLQPAHVQTFLLYTSILEKLNGSLCDALMNQEWKQSGENSQVILEYLERSNLFLISLDDKRIWFRYHHLFTDLLRARLQISLGARGIAQLHILAADWHGQNGSTTDAIHHASMASDDERVERFIEQNYMELVSRGEQAWLRSWTSKLSKKLVYCRPWLCIYEAYSHAWFGELDQADAFLEAAEKGIQSEIHVPDANEMVGHIDYIKSRVAAMRGDLLRAIELNLAAREFSPANNMALQLDLGITLGYLYFMNGDYSHASQYLNETIRSGRSVGAVLNTVAGYCILARLCANRGQLNQSYELYRQAAQWVQETGEQHLGASSLVEIGFADVLCEHNNLEAALLHAKRGLALLPLWGKADDLVLAYITMARIALAKTNRHAAIEAIEKAQETIRTTGVFPEALLAVELAQVKLWLAQGDLQSASRWTESLQNRFGSNVPITFENELTCIAWARVLIAQNKPYEAIDLLLSLEEVVRSFGRQGRLIEIMILKALALKAMGDTTQANVAIMESLTLAEPEGYMRIFLDEGGPMLKLLSHLSQSNLLNESPSYTEFVNRLLGTFDLKEKIIA
jgi:LuxR family maltose regulon positive regulatory protein